MKTKLPVILSLITAASVYAGSATWNLNPGGSDWNTGTNWTPETVPNGPADTATFGISDITTITTPADEELDGLVFLSGASAYTFALAGPRDFTFSGTGIINNSGQTQTFAQGPSHLLIFTNGASAGSQTLILGDVTFRNDSSAGSATFQVGEGHVQFFNTSTADHATFLNGGFDQRQLMPGRIEFFDQSSAGNGYFVNNGNSAGLDNRGFCLIAAGASAGDATFINNASPASNGSPGATTLSGSGDNATFVANGTSFPRPWGGQVAVYGDAGAGTYTANGGSNRGMGGMLCFFAADASAAKCILNGNGMLNLTGTPFPGLTLGSLEGDGLVLLGERTLTIGSNNRNTTFSGTIQDSGAVAKIGVGTLTLTGANLYGGGTTVASGILLVSNVSGSGTGTGAVNINADTLGGSGIIAGAVTVGTNTGAQAFLAPSKGVKKPATLTMQGALTLNDDSTYIYQLNTKRAVSDEVIANGVVIDGGAKFSFRPSEDNALTLGQVFTVINNTAATPVAGTFHNLPEGKIIAVNGSKLQASYTGGDGNDLTLTVVP